MRLSRPQLITVIITAIAAIALLVVIITDVTSNSKGSSEGADKGSAASAQAKLLQRPNSHVLEKGRTDKAVLVEFLDFECEACGQMYPVIEQLREKYDGELTFVVRYFPGQGHTNSRTAAHAAEAAARQGKFEEMYNRLFTTQAEWGESSESKADLFRSYADELGLDMKQYDKDVKSSSVAKRVQSDFDDAISLDLSGTPSLFLNGERLQPRSAQEFDQAIAKALAK